MMTLIARMPNITYDAPRMKKLSLLEVGQAIKSMNDFGRDEWLEEKKLRPEEVQQVIRFITALNGKQISRLLPNNAVTLLRLTPGLLEAKSSFTVHDAIKYGAPVVLDLMNKAPEESPEKQFYHNLMATAGRVCFDKRLAATDENRRLDEFEMFRPFVGQTPDYKTALAKYRVHHQVGLVNRRLIEEKQR